MGNRIMAEPMFAALNATCHLAPDRREYASPLRFVSIAGEAHCID